jgi:hypothetical protein
MILIVLNTKQMVLGVCRTVPRGKCPLTQGEKLVVGIRTLLKSHCICLGMEDEQVDDLWGSRVRAMGEPWVRGG